MSDNGYPRDSTQVPVLRRVIRPEEIPTGAVLLADCSYSMAWGDDGRYDRMGVQQPDFTPAGSRRIDRLARVLAYVLTYTRLQALVAFADAPVELPVSGRVALPEPSGGTALDLALEHVARMRPRPLKCMVLSDGSPNSPEAALTAARLLKPMVIDAFYLGPDEHAEALAFMRALAACGGPGGKSGRFDLCEPLQVAETIRLRLTDQRGRQ